MRMLITGAGGMLGQDLVAAVAARGHDPVGLTRRELDITDSAAVAAALPDTCPEVVINCAAWTDVDGAEESVDAALAVNRTGSGNLARVAAGTGAWTVHISSDYVFDGTKREPYLETDPTGPLSAYGRSKLAGEAAVAEAAPDRHTVVRSSWLFGAGGPCFPKTILRRAAQHDHLDVVDDQVGCPTFSAHLAVALIEVAQRRPLGVVHLAGQGSCSWYEFALEIVAKSGLECQVRPVSTAQMPRPAQRPAYSVLGTQRADEIPALPHWRKGLEEFLAVPV